MKKNDLTDQLREQAGKDWREVGPGRESHLFITAAKEIEHLREKLASLEQDLSDAGDEQRAVVEFATEGLTIDGAHHKQWFLEQIAYTHGEHLEDLEYDEGIAP